jgi:hypothetical protein
VSGFDLGALDPVFLAIERANLDVILVGGHAVSFYAANYSDRCPDLLRYFPLRSKDADWIGTIDDGMRLASALRLDWRRNPRKGGMQGLSLGRIDLQDPPGGKIEILGNILGADGNEVRETAVTESARGFTIRLINPFLLYETKGINLVRIPQRGPATERQDAKQFVVMGIIITALLREMATTSVGERAFIKSSGRLLGFCLTPEGAALVKAGAMDPFKLLPLAVMEKHASESVRNLVTKRLPHFQRQLELVLKAVPAEEMQRVQGDLRAMEMDVGARSRQANFDNQRERQLRIHRALPERRAGP